MGRAEKVQNREQTDDPDETSERPIDKRMSNGRVSTDGISFLSLSLSLSLSFYY